MDHRKISNLTLPPCCGHGENMMEDMRRQQELVVQLRALVLPLLHGVHGTSADIALQLFDDVIGCNISVASKLQCCLMMSSGGAGDGGGTMADLVDDKSLVRKSNNSSKEHLHSGDDRKEKQAAKPNNNVGQKRRRNDKRSRSLVTYAPHYDGHQWRKYGQKNINGRKHPRNYYRCAYKDERNCLATKTIEQQQEQNASTSSAMVGDQENAKYTVVYYGDHTCKDDHAISMVQAPQHVNMDLQNGEMAQTTTNNVHEPDSDLDLPALLEVFDSSLINWDEEM